MFDVEASLHEFGISMLRPAFTDRVRSCMISIDLKKNEVKNKIARIMFTFVLTHHIYTGFLAAD